MQTRPVVSVLSAPLTAELARIAHAGECELLEIERKGSVLRFVLDSGQGVTHADCESFSKQAGALLDLEDFGSSRYVLEVSSPGLDRKLYLPEDYRRFTGRLVRVRYRGAEGSRRTVVARLDGLGDDEDPVLRLSPCDGTEPIRLPLSAIETARLEIDI